MSSELSPYAVHQIIEIIDDRLSQTVEKASSQPYAYDDYDDSYDDSLTIGYLRSLELKLYLNKGSDDEVVQTVFGHGKPMVFDRDHPRPLVPAVVEGFKRLKAQPSFLDITLGGAKRMDLFAEWPQAYVDYVPCGRRTTLDGPGKAVKKNLRESQGESPAPVLKAPQFVVETFRIPSKHSDKPLTVELYFALRNRHVYRSLLADPARPATAPDLEKRDLRHVKVRLGNPPCSGTSNGPARRSKSLLIQSDSSPVVYGFLDRAHVGTSLLANRALNVLLLAYRKHLPVHHLMCAFDKDVVFTGAYWLVLRHFRSDLLYSDQRRFKIPSEAGPAVDCALIVRHLSDCQLFDFKPPESDAPFTLKMLAALANRNFSIGALRMRTDGGGLSDYRSMNTVFGGGMRLAAIELRLFDHKFTSLVKTTDFFRMPTVQRLKALKLHLEEPYEKADAPRRWAIVSSPLWIAGIYLLRSCERFEVKYESNRRVQKVAHKLVQLCEKFERGEISELVPRCKFASSNRVAFPFNVDNKIASGVAFDDYEWDVYRFRNATTDDWITACVGTKSSQYSHNSVLHIVKGKAYPDTTFSA